MESQWVISDITYRGWNETGHHYDFNNDFWGTLADRDEQELSSPWKGSIRINVLWRKNKWVETLQRARESHIHSSSICPLPRPWFNPCNVRKSTLKMDIVQTKARNILLLTWIKIQQHTDGVFLWHSLSLEKKNNTITIGSKAGLFKARLS